MGCKAAAEIGVEQGEYSKVLIQGTVKLSLIDPWAGYPGYRDHVSQDKLNGFYHKVCDLSLRYQPGMYIVRDYSVHAAERFVDGSLDLVYIDANHSLPCVIEDLRAWVPKVRSGGIIAGHDYRKPKNNIGHHVVEAVNAWTYSYRVNPWYLLGAKDDAKRDQNRTWLWVKP